MGKKIAKIVIMAATFICVLCLCFGCGILDESKDEDISYSEIEDKKKTEKENKKETEDDSLTYKIDVYGASSFYETTEYYIDEKGILTFVSKNGTEVVSSSYTIIKR